MSQSLFLDESQCDVILKVRAKDGYTWRFPAHALILHHACPRLAQALEERENEATEPKTITVVDVEPHNMLRILRYIYTGQIPLDPDIPLLLTAGRYGLQSLQSNLEETLLNFNPFPVSLACKTLHIFRESGPKTESGPLARHCRSIVARHSVFVFGSDLVLDLEESDLESVLARDDLNVPDEAVPFWGVWRWGRRRCSRNGAELADENVLARIDSLLPLLRMSSLRRRDGVPPKALDRFDRCRCRRRRYSSPQDILEQCSALYVAPKGWKGLGEGDQDDSALCLQISTNRRAFLVGLELDLCKDEPSDIFIRIVRESDGQELRREKVRWDEAVCRKLTTGHSEPETWLEGSSVFSTPLVITQDTSYSLYLVGNLSGVPYTPSHPRNRNLDGQTVTVHSPQVRAIRTLYLWTNAEISWDVEDN